jgi:hypothetical protein
MPESPYRYSSPTSNSASKPDGPESANILAPDEHGIFLSNRRPTFSSPNGAYLLTLQASGDLMLTHNVDGRSLPLWWTGTGDRTQRGHNVSLAFNWAGDTVVVVGALLDDSWSTVWHSDLEPACRQRKLSQADANRGDLAQTISVGASTQLELSDSGRLRITGVCDLHIPARERNKERSLAVIVAGLYRTHNVTCNTHMQSFIKKHSAFSRIDVFAYMLYEAADLDVYGRTPGSIEAAVRECYGPYLRTIEVERASKVEEEYPGGELAMLQPCGTKLRRLNNQLKTLDSAARIWWDWTVENGFLQDTVLRIRPDTEFWGRKAPEFWGLEELGENTLVLPHPHREHYFYCARMSGRVGIGKLACLQGRLRPQKRANTAPGPTDQIAYGSPAAMAHWLHMYRSFTDMVDLAANADRPAFRDFSGCEDLPSGPAPSDCPNPAPCSMECLVAWYLEARGVQFNIEWGWEQNLLRKEDIEA